MPSNAPFRRRTLATLVAAACGTLPLVGHAAARAGQVDFAVGNVTATGGDGSTRALGKGAKIQVGDTIDTNQGRAWLRFKDGGYMSLQPGTQFRVDDYKFEGEEDGSEKSFFSLLKGGVRAITGIIGSRNRDSYRVNTPVATIGIRGTEYLAQLGNSLTVSCGEGVCVVTNDAGEVVLQAGQTVYFQDRNSRGERVTRKVVLPPNANVELFTTGEFRDADGDLSVLPVFEPDEEPPVEEVLFSEDVPLVPGENDALFLALSYSGDGGEFGEIQAADTLLEKGVPSEQVIAMLDGDLRLTDAMWKDDAESETFDKFLDFGGEGGFADTGTDADNVIAWGRWTGGFAQSSSFPVPFGGYIDLGDGNESVHYLTGVPTPESDLMNLKALGATATYNLIGATTPTFGDDGFEGSIDFGDAVAVSGQLNANFATSKVNTNLSLDFTDNDVTIQANGLPIQSGKGGVFTGAGTYATSTIGSGPFNTQIKGFFAGGAATKAGYGYDVYVPVSGGYTIHGVVAFKQGGAPNTITFDVPE